MISLLWLLLSSLLAPVLAVQVLSSPEELNSTQYDFVIVGGGTAGLVLATRLTEDPTIKVLVVEAGGSNEGVLAAIVPFLAVTLTKTQVDWNFTTTPQAGLLNRSIPFARGHVLGGSSSINIMAYNRGSNDVWDNWAKITGDNGWSWNSVEQFYLKSSRLVPSADGHDTSAQVVASAHGNGPVEVSIPGFPTELDDLVIDTSKQLGGRFKYTEDLNVGDFVGFSMLQSTIGNSRRSSSAVAYLDPLQGRDNLVVLITTQATKLIQSGTDNGVPAFRTVEIAQSASSTRFQVHATKEVILSAGVVGTPKTLTLSGIGGKETLQGLGITTLVDLPDVGQNLTDQPLVANYFFVNSTGTFDEVLRNQTVFGEDLDLWNRTGQGRFVDSASNTQGFMRLPDDSPIFNSFSDPSAGPLSGHTELLFIDGFSPFGTVSQPPTGNYMSVLTVVVSPVSRGSITFSSSDPFAAPIINPNYLTSDFDIFAMVQAMKDTQEFIKATPWNGFILSPFGDLANATTDDALANYARTFAVTINHGVGTARMSPAGANWGVVDTNLLVKGASGLRVVDASVFPAMPECHTQAPTYIVAERAAQLIKTAYNIAA